MKQNDPFPLLVILGPTASGKTALAVAVANRINGAIISADSRQVYRGMDIGTGKDIAEYGGVPYHLIDIRDAGETYHVAQYQRDFEYALKKIRQQGKRPVLCGGTGLYIQAALQGYTFSEVPVVPERRTELEQEGVESLIRLLGSLPLPPGFTPDVSTKKRLIRAIEIAEWCQRHAAPIRRDLPLQASIFGITPPVTQRRQRITARLKSRLDNGLIDEVQTLLDQGITPQQLIRYGLEYKYTTQYLLGEMDYSTFFSRLNTEIHRYAKRQMTYFRKMEKDGLRIHWLEAGSVNDRVDEILQRVTRKGH